MLNVTRELEQIERESDSGAIVHFFDSSLSANKERAFDLANFIIANISKVSFSCDLELSAIEDSLLRKLADAKFISVSIGFESADNGILKYMNKRGTFQDRIALAKQIRQAMPCTIIKAYWLLGLPGSTIQSLEKELESIKWLLESGTVDLVSGKLLVPYPGTQLFESPERFGIIVRKGYSQYDRYSIPPVSFPIEVGSEYLSETLIKCERLIANCYATRLNTSIQAIASPNQDPGRYNGSLYT